MALDFDGPRHHLIAEARRAKDKLIADLHGGERSRNDDMRLCLETFIVFRTAADELLELENKGTNHVA